MAAFLGPDMKEKYKSIKALPLSNREVSRRANINTRMRCARSTFRYELDHLPMVLLHIAAKTDEFFTCT